MVENLLTLTILFFVIIDPLVSFAVFLAATKSMQIKEKKKIALIATSIALGLSMLVLLLDVRLLELFSTNLDEFRVAGGIVLGILGVKIALGIPLSKVKDIKKDSTIAIGSVLGTPLITGPATILTIIVSSQDYGSLQTGIALLSVIIFTGTVLFFSDKLKKILNEEVIRVISPILGLIIISWSIKFITQGIKSIFFI